MSQSIYLKNQLEKIIDVHEFSAGIEDEINKATHPEEHHSETVAYRLENICLHGGQIASLTHTKNITYQKTSAMPALNRKVIKTGALCTTAAGFDYFAHLLYDDYCTTLLARNFSSPYMVHSRFSANNHAKDYRRLMDVKMTMVDTCFFEELWIFDDYALNSHRRERLETLRTNIASHSPELSPPPAYLTRGTTGSTRKLLNEEKLIDTLANHGFQIIDPMQLNATELVQKLNGSPLIMGIEGSQLVHGLLNVIKGGYIFCLQPPDRFNAIYRPLADAINLNWAFVVGTGSINGFSISIDEVMKTLDLCL